MYEATFPLGHPFRFSSFDTTIQLSLNNTNIACMRAHITPYVGPVTSKLLMGVPLAVMLLSGIVTGVTKAYQKRRKSTFRYDVEDDLRNPIESTMPGLGYYLHYLQFIFLTGCLTLSYPGFYRAVVSSLSWSSLIFRNWPVTHQFKYPGVEDGIYATNSTFGLEEMAQFLGSTTTSDLWTNSIVNLCLLIAGVVVAIQLMFLFEWMHALYSSQGIMRPAVYLQREMPALLRRTGWGVARLVLDYFLHPIIALSLYQMNNARWFALSHTSTALVLVATLAGILTVVVRRLVKTNRQAVFFQQTFLPWGFGQHWGSYTLYSVPFIRGVAIGGLQLSGLAELVILLLCEICIFICGFWNWHTGFTWQHALLAGARLATLIMAFLFVTEAGASERTKSIAAYSILSLHITVILGGLAVDCIYKPLRYILYKYGVLYSVPDHLDSNKAPVFGLTQLSHRSTRRFSFTHLPALDPAVPPSPHTRHSTSVHRPGSSDPSSHSGDGIESFFRPPRHNPLVYYKDRDYFSTHFPQSTATSDYSMDTAELVSLDNIYESINSTEYYSMRESDQFYRPRKHTAPNKRRSYTEMPGNSKRAKRSRWKRQWKRQKPQEKKFEVIRPRATWPENVAERG
ncbi:hypothetical protein BDW69DRAFT_175056 [Aspergillus filifer]